MCNSNKITIGCLVRWNERALNDEIFWSAQSKEPVRVKKIETHEGTIWEHERTIHFETPIEKNWSGETLSAFECWLEHCCNTVAKRTTRVSEPDNSICNVKSSPSNQAVT
jgi:hypothetical protein